MVFSGMDKDEFQASRNRFILGRVGVRERVTFDLRYRVVPYTNAWVDGVGCARVKGVSGYTYRRGFVRPLLLKLSIENVLYPKAPTSGRGGRRGASRRQCRQSTCVIPPAADEACIAR